MPLPVGGIPLGSIDSKAFQHDRHSFREAGVDIWRFRFHRTSYCTRACEGRVGAFASVFAVRTRANFLRPMGRVGQIQIVRANLRKTDDCAMMLRDADAAINLVGILYERGVQRFQELHSESAGAFARAAAEYRVARLIQFSALGANPQSPSLYARSKAEGEKRVWEAFPDATIVRPSIVFGPEDDFFNRFAQLARISPVLPLIGGGHTRFQPVYVRDVAEAVAVALNDIRALGTTYEFGGPEVMTLKEVMELVLHETRRKRVLLNVPFGIAKLNAAFLGLLPKPLLTIDQVRLLQTDNVVSPEAPGLTDLGSYTHGRRGHRAVLSLALPQNR